MNEFFSGYDKITVSYLDDELQTTQSVMSTIGGPSDNADGGEFDMMISSSGNNIAFEVKGNNKDIVNREFTVMAENTAESEIITTSFTVSSEISQGTAPSQTGTFPATVTVSGSDSVVFAISNYFTDYDFITVSFTDESTQSTQIITLDTNSQTGNTIYNDGNFEIALLTLLGNDNIRFTGKNIYEVSDVVITVSNDFGQSSQTTQAIFTVVSGAVAGDTPSWIPEVDDAQKPFYALLIIIGIAVVVGMSARNDSFLASAIFGAAAIVGAFLLLTYMGWIPIVYLVIFLLVIVGIGAHIVTKAVSGGG